jgi:predicted DNA-binding protein YlxM (UPF0122 family)
MKRRRNTSPKKISSVPTSEIIELYVNHELSSSEIGRRFGLTRQAVCARLKTAGVAARPGGSRPPVFEKEFLEKVYVHDRLTVAEVADKLNTTNAIILRAMKIHGIKRRSPGTVKYLQLRELEIGVSVDLPKLLTRPRPHTQFYQMATKIGIRVSVRSIDKKTFRVTRIE